MSEILLQAKDTKLTLIGPKTLVGTQVNYDTLKVDFGAEWDGFIKTAVFYTGNKEPLNMILNVDDTCLVPWEQTEESGILYVGVFGVKEDVEVPTNFVMLRVLEGSAGNNVPPPPTIDVYMQIIEQMRLTREYTLDKSNIAKDKALEAFNSARDAKASEDNAKTSEDNTEEYKNAALEKLDEVVTTNQGLAENIRVGAILKTDLDNDITVGAVLKQDLDDDITDGNAIHNTLANVTTGTIKQATDKDTALKQSITDAGTSKSALDGSIAQVTPLKNGLDTSIGIATPLKSDLDISIGSANTINDTLTNPTTGTIKQANDINNALINPSTGAIKLATDAKLSLETAVANNQVALKTELGTLANLTTTDKTNAVKAINEVDGSLKTLKSDYTSLNIGTRLNILESAKIKKYGVKFTGSNPIGVRIHDAIGMVANVAVDNAVVQNDFDKVSFYNRPMCNVYFDATGKPIVMAYRGEPGFNLQGAVFSPYVDKADVYYECSPCAWNGSFDEPVVTGTPTEGFELFPCFPNWNTKIYLPAYWMSVVDNKPTSRSGTLPGYFSINTAFTTAQAWNTNAHGETILAHMYEYILQVVEFATRDPQTIMTGAMSLRYNSATDTAIISEIGVNRIILANASADQYVVGQTIVIGTTQNGDNVAKERSITAIEIYDASNKVISFDGAPVNIAVGNFVSSRVWKNGATDIVTASSGSPVSNTNGKYPCIWRGKVDPWANGYSGICDLLVKRSGAGTVEDPYIYKPYYLPNPRKYSNGAITADYVELNYNMAQADGYALILGQDARYKSIALTKTIGASSTTYFSDYYYYPRYDISAVFVGGFFFSGRVCGPLYFSCNNTPSIVDFGRLARLFVSRA